MDKTFWDVLVELCNKNNITANKLCKDIGLSNGIATYWKKGVLPKTEALIKIADYFDVSIDHLLNITLNPEKESLWADFALLNETGQQKAKEYLQDLLANPKYLK